MGTLVDGLERRGVLDNTLILFLSDNGGNAEGGPPGTTRGNGPIGGPQSYVLLGMDWATLANTPFRRFKHFTHEGGISTPLIAHWPAGIPADAGHSGETAGAPDRHHGDRRRSRRREYPREFAGNAIEPMQGVSLRPALLGKPLNRTEPIFWEHEGNKAVRDGKWKLVLRHRQPWRFSTWRPTAPNNTIWRSNSRNESPGSKPPGTPGRSGPLLMNGPAPITRNGEKTSNLSGASSPDRLADGCDQFVFVGELACLEFGIELLAAHGQLEAASSGGNHDEATDGAL